MCNLYDIGPAPGRELRCFDWEDLVAEIVDRQKLTYVAPGKTGVVVRMAEDGGSIEATPMRWGFHRQFEVRGKRVPRDVNNARDDKLSGRMWNRAWRERRCLVPVVRFYEWSGPKGSKTKHAITAAPPDRKGVWFYIAGIWEESSNPEMGLSYSMITTGCNAQMEPVHDRMPAILPRDACEAFLGADPPAEFSSPYAGKLVMDPPLLL